MKFTPRQYQKNGANFLKSRKYAMLGDAPGVGKTGQAIMAANKDWKILVVCPASIKLQWKQAWNDWAGLNGLDVVIIDSSRIIPISRVTIVNYDLIIREKILEALLKNKFDLIIFDEAHKLKSLSAKRTRIALGGKYLKSRAERIWFLTGTPVKNRTVDLFPILRTCAPEVLGKYESFLKFAYRYCGAYVGSFGLNTSGASHTDELRERLKPFMLRREKRDVLDELPPRIINKVDLECTPQVKKIIQLEELKTIEQAGDNDPSLFKLGEIARIRQALAKYKAAVCIDYIKDLLEGGEKIVVFFYHKEVLNDLRRAFGKVPHVYVDGSITCDKRSAVVEAFRKRKEVQLFFGQMQACGEGIDGLQDVSSDCVFVEPSWSHTDIEQCIGRLERSGQRNDVNVHILVIKDTLEARMMDVVTMKLNVDKKLYNQKENVMAKETKQEKKEPLEIIAASMVEIAAALTKVSAILVQELGKKEVKVSPVTQDDTPAQAVEIKTLEDEVTEDAIRARAADVCELTPDGSAKEKVMAAIKKIGGGRIADLKTPEMRKKAMEALDKLYSEFDV